MQQKNLVRRLNENVDDDREVNFQNKICDIYLQWLSYKIVFLLLYL